MSKKDKPEIKHSVELTESDKAIAEKAAKLIVRDYGETLRRLAENDN